MRERGPEPGRERERQRERKKAGGYLILIKVSSDLVSIKKMIVFRRNNIKYIIFFNLTNKYELSINPNL